LILAEASLDHSSDGNAVQVITIDEIIGRYKLDGEGFLKMDIESAEMDSLMGAQNTLKTLKPRLAITVYHEYENARKFAAIIKDIRQVTIVSSFGECTAGMMLSPDLISFLSGEFMEACLSEEDKSC